MLIAGVAPVNGKRDPVRLVNTVVTRKMAVQRSSLWLLRNPYITTIPDAIPARLINTRINQNHSGLLWDHALTH